MNSRREHPIDVCSGAGLIARGEKNKVRIHFFCILRRQNSLSYLRVGLRALLWVLFTHSAVCSSLNSNTRARTRAHEHREKERPTQLLESSPPKSHFKLYRTVITDTPRSIEALEITRNGIRTSFSASEFALAC